MGGGFNWQDGAAADWLAQRLDDEAIVYADLYGGLFLQERVDLYGRAPWFPDDIGRVPKDSTIYLITWNIDRQEITYHAGIAGCRKSVNFSKDGVDDLIKRRNRIYNNGGAQVFR